MGQITSCLSALSSLSKAKACTAGRWAGTETTGRLNRLSVPGWAAGPPGCGVPRPALSPSSFALRRPVVALVCALTVYRRYRRTSRLSVRLGCTLHPTSPHLRLPRSPSWASWVGKKYPESHVSSAAAAVAEAGAHVASWAGLVWPGLFNCTSCPSRTMANLERTFIAIKPDGVQRGLVGDIIKRFEQKGFRLVAMKFLRVTCP